MSGKGDTRRPQQVSEEEFAERFWQTFGEETERELEQQSTKGESKTHPGKERDRGQRG